MKKLIVIAATLISLMVICIVPASAVTADCEPQFEDENYEYLDYFIQDLSEKFQVDESQIFYDHSDNLTLLVVDYENFLMPDELVPIAEFTRAEKISSSEDAPIAYFIHSALLYDKVTNTSWVRLKLMNSYNVVQMVFPNLVIN